MLVTNNQNYNLGIREVSIKSNIDIYQYILISKKAQLYFKYKSNMMLKHELLF